MKPEKNPEAQAIAREMFETNKSLSAQVRDDELELVRNGGPLPADLRNLPRDQWDAFIDCHLAVPDVVADILAAQPEGPLAREVVWKLEELVESHHGITAPYYVTTTPPLHDHKRGWDYVPDAAAYKTGFLLGKEETKDEAQARWEGK